MPKKPPLDVLLAEVNHHLPEGLQLRPPITKKAIRYARSCLAFTYADEERDGVPGRSGMLGPLNAALDQIELALESETPKPEPSSSSKPAPSTTPPPQHAKTAPPPRTEPPKTEPPKTEPPKTEPPKTEPPKTASSSAEATSEHERWRVPRDDETPAERAFREALEAVERKNREERAARTTQSAAFVAADAARCREALEVVERYFNAGRHGDAVVDTPEAKAILALRKALLTTLDERKKSAQ